MASVRPDENPRDLVATFEEVLHDWSKGFYTCIPGRIVQYDDATRRATVQPALREREEDGSTHERPAVRDCPVLWPGANGVTAHGRLKKDDPVGLLYSMRGYRGFLATHELADQDVDGTARSASSPLVWPLFGRHGKITAPAGGFKDGYAIQTDDGVRFVRIDTEGEVVEMRNASMHARLQADSGALEHHVADTGVRVTSSGIEFRVGGNVVARFTAASTEHLAPAHTHRGTNVGDTHTHPGVMPGAGVTGAPQ